MGNLERKQEHEKENVFVIALIGGENYAIDVAYVNNVNRFAEIRPVPNTKPFMIGLMMLRGTIIPVIDMRVFFNLDSSTYTKTTVIITISVYDRLIGLLVDEVLDVTNLPASKIQNTPHFSVNINADCVTGISEVRGKLVVMLNVNNIISEKDIENFTNDALNL